MDDPRVDSTLARAVKPCTLSATPMSTPKTDKRRLSAPRRDELLDILKARFEKHASRHHGLDWSAVEAKLEANPSALWSLHEMERTGGEPDIVSFESRPREIVFVDCSPQSPKGRYSLCFDDEALAARKEHKPKGSAMGLAAAMGGELLSEDEYLELQTRGEFDTKTSSWLRTPPEIRKLGGAIFGDRRFGRTFIYHNGAESYYSGRGFRCALRV